MASRESTHPQNVLGELLAPHQPPCLSLYQPTHRRYPENQQDPIRFRNLVKALAGSLHQGDSKPHQRALLEPFEALALDVDFWNHTLDGLAVLGCPGLFRTVKLPRPVPALAIVADSFHLKPLLRYLQSTDRYQVLGLSREAVRLFEGDRDSLEEVELAPGVPRTIGEALGDQLTEPHQTVGSYGGVGGASNPMHHGQGGKKDEVGRDTERFFRAVDKAVLEHHCRPPGLPLMLAALPEYHHLFRQVSHNPALIGEAIEIDPFAVSLEELCSLAWRAIEPRFSAQIAELKGEFEQARAHDTGSDQLAEVARAAMAGRVATLLLDADQRVAGHLDTMTGRLEVARRSDPGAEDLLDDLGELVVAKGGRVLVLPADRMPTRTGLAATYRY